MQEIQATASYFKLWLSDKNPSLSDASKNINGQNFFRTGKSK